jgi:hypothetical protein
MSEPNTPNPQPAAPADEPEIAAPAENVEENPVEVVALGAGFAGRVIQPPPEQPDDKKVPGV